MMVLLSKQEYDDLVSKATAVDLLAEQKAEVMKENIRNQLLNACKDRSFASREDFMVRLRDILATHY